jgi:hypothetical protein
MFDFFRSYPWVLVPHYYESQEQLIAVLPAIDRKIAGPVSGPAMASIPSPPH